MDVQRIAFLMGQGRLHVRSVVVEVEQVNAEQFLLEERFPLQQPHIHAHLGQEIQLGLQIEQVAELAVFVLPHGRQFGPVDLAVADPLDVRHVPRFVLGQHRAGDVLHVGAQVQLDSAPQRRADDQQLQCRLDPDAERHTELVLLLAPGAGHDPPVFELRQGKIGDEKAVQCVQRVAGRNCLADPVGVVAESQVHGGLEVSVGAHRDAGHLDVQRVDRHVELGPELQQWHFVSEQRRVAALQQLHPIVEVQQILDKVKPGPLGGAPFASVRLLAGGIPLDRVPFVAELRLGILLSRRLVALVRLLGQRHAAR